ncbi:hypothetical protein B296_00050176, partial [Ensete ventricosum]
RAAGCWYVAAGMRGLPPLACEAVAGRGPCLSDGRGQIRPCMTVTPHHRVRPWVRGHHSSTCGVRRCLCSFGLLHRIPFVLMHNNNRSNCVTANSHHHRGNQIKSPPSQGIALSHLLLVRLARATHGDAKVIFLEGACCVVIWNLLQSSDPATARILSGPFDASDCNAALGRWLLLFPGPTKK